MLNSLGLVVQFAHLNDVVLGSVQLHSGVILTHDADPSNLPQDAILLGNLDCAEIEVSAETGKISVFEYATL